MPRPVNRVLGKILLGSFVSSAMFTESSKPTIAKNASEVAVLMARKTFLPSGVSKATTRDQSACPPKMANRLMKMTISRPDSSIRVSTTLRPTPSATPRKLTVMMSSMNAMAMSSSAAGPASRPNPTARLLAKALDAAEALVIPELITVKQTMNVTKWMPNALCT